VLVQEAFEELDHLFGGTIARGVVGPTGSMIDPKGRTQVVDLGHKLLSAVGLEDPWRALHQPQGLEGLGHLGRFGGPPAPDGEGPGKLGEDVHHHHYGFDAPVGDFVEVKGVDGMVAHTVWDLGMGNATGAVKGDLVHLLALQEGEDVFLGDAGIGLLDEGVEGVAAPVATEVGGLEEGGEDGVPSWTVIGGYHGEVIGAKARGETEGQGWFTVW
jgi:hypothetical protein